MDTITLAFIVASTTFNLPPGLLSAVCFVESSHKPYAFRMDDNGSPSIGLCQIKEKTAKYMGFSGQRKELLDARVNAYYAAKYVRHQLNRYHGDLYCAVIAYNAGHCKLVNGKAKNHFYAQKVFKSWKEHR